MAVLGRTKRDLDFNDMTCTEVAQSLVLLQINTTGYGASSTTTFWERFDRMGAYTANAAMTADTYYTQVDVSGSGYLGTIMTPCLGTGTASHTVKVTIDGTAIERTVDPYGSSTTKVLIFGPPGRLMATTADSGYQKLLRGYNLSIFDSFGSGDYNVENYQETDHTNHLSTTDFMHNMGVPVIPFRDGLKVELKQSSTGPNSFYAQRAGVLYMRTD